MFFGPVELLTPPNPPHHPAPPRPPSPAARVHKDQAKLLQRRFGFNRSLAFNAGVLLIDLPRAERLKRREASRKFAADEAEAKGGPNSPSW